MREKREVNAMTLALSSLFDSKVLQEYNRAIDEALGQSAIFEEVAPVEEAPSAPRPSRRSDSQKFADAKRSTRELNKLNVLLAGGKR